MMAQRRRNWIRYLRPGILLPVVLAAALLAFAFSIVDRGQVLRDIRSVPLAALAGTLGLAIAYLAVKCFQFRLLLRGLGIYPDWRQLVVAFSVGEMTLTIPSGVYLQNYVLKYIQGAGFARSSAATTAVLILESVLVFLTLAVIPVPEWAWLRPTVAGMLAAAGLAALILYRLWVGRRALRSWLSRGSVGRGIVEMMEGLVTLWATRPVAGATLLSAVYLGLLVCAFLLIGRGVGVEGLTFRQALTIYFFSLGVILMLGGILSQLGVMEVAGLEVARAWGYTSTQGLAMLLGFRIVWVLSIWLVSGVMIVVLRSQLRASHRDGSEEPVH